MLNLPYQGCLKVMYRHLFYEYKKNGLIDFIGMKIEWYAKNFNGSPVTETLLCQFCAASPKSSCKVPDF